MPFMDIDRSSIKAVTELFFVVEKIKIGCVGHKSSVIFCDFFSRDRSPLPSTITLTLKAFVGN
jgi:hypothetical protein